MHMKYKNPIFKKTKNGFPLEVLCGNCKTPILVYEKGGNGNLIKLQFYRIIESEFDLRDNEGQLECMDCKEVLANRGDFHGNLTYFLLRGKTNDRKLRNYKY